MKKIFSAFAAVLFAFLLCSAPAGAAQPVPGKQDILVMKHNLLTLWNMGIMSPPQLDEAGLLHASLRFLLRGQFEDSVESSDEYPSRFVNLPPQYSLFIPKKTADATAFLVFNGFTGKSLPNGVFLGAEGYYIDPEALLEGVYEDADSYLPSYCTIESMMQQKNGTLILNGKVRRFKQNPDTFQEILWASAPFMARFVPVNGGWQLTTFIFTEEAMG